MKILVEDTPLDTLCSRDIRFTTTLWRNEKYARRSEEVHFALGIFIILSLASWTPAVVPELVLLFSTDKKKIRPAAVGLRTAQKLVGIVQIITGVYLFVWVLFLLRPAQLKELRRFAWRDLVQRQHLALAANLAVAGICELDANIALAFINTVCSGLIFLSHPQRTLFLSAQHFVIGSSLIFGAAFLAAEKLNNFSSALQAWSQPSVVTAIRSPLVYAAISFGLAASILIHFQEEYPRGTLPTDLHFGTKAKCHHGKFTALFAFFVAFMTIFFLILRRLLPSDIQRVEHFQNTTHIQSSFHDSSAVCLLRRRYHASSMCEPDAQNEEEEYVEDVEEIDGVTVNYQQKTTHS